MSFIGSTERTRGTVSKLFCGGGDWVNHSSVFAFHGSGPAIAPCLRLRSALTAVTRMPTPRMKAPIVEIRLKVARLPTSAYSGIRRGMPSRPIECWTRNVVWKPISIVQKLILPSFSSIIRPVIFGNQ